jgi:hypothetical protein
MNPVGKHSADARSCAEDVVEYSLRGSEVPSKRERTSPCHGPVGFDAMGDG